MYKQFFVFGSRLLGLNHVWQLSGQAFWAESAEKPAIAAEPSAKMHRDYNISHHDYLDIMAPVVAILKQQILVFIYAAVDSSNRLLPTTNILSVISSVILICGLQS